MPNDYFSFKRFTVRQSDTAMKVGTDGVLLGAWARMDAGPARILDVGTGTGIIALIAAQRTENTASVIDAVEIDGPAATQAAANAAASPWKERINIYNMSLGEFAQVCSCGKQGAGRRDATSAESSGMRYDHIISNPPYFSHSLHSPDRCRSIARHTTSLTHEELIGCCSALLCEGGALSVIIPAGSEASFIRNSRILGLELSRSTSVHTTPAKPPKRILLEFRKCYPGGPRVETEVSQLTLSAPDGTGYSPQYRELTRDLYLKF